ncbi:hypothetical protein DS62_00840 [Smithella sp. SC_K08D17]|jgi:hypothetical protein|nr:hypothetical protein KD27_07125 [Smithella sp. D17]KIE17755.1 hypothetical protein DS62_00840 [Smithella sp. SC_K08D17]
MVKLNLTDEGKADAERIIHIFKHYMENEGQTVDSMHYEKNLQEKLRHQGFLSDLNPLLPADTTYDIEMAFLRIRNDLLRKIEDKLK